MKLHWHYNICSFLHEKECPLLLMFLSQAEESSLSAVSLAQQQKEQAEGFSGKTDWRAFIRHRVTRTCRSVCGPDGHLLKLIVPELQLKKY